MKVAIGVLAALPLLVGAAAPPVTALEWLARMSLSEPVSAVVARFGAPPGRVSAGGLVTLTFPQAPAGVAMPEKGEDVHGHGEADYCNAEASWTVNVWHGQVQSILFTAPSPVAMDGLTKLNLTSLGGGELGGVRFEAWQAGEDQLLVAVGVEREKRAAARWVLIRQSLAKHVYPELMAVWTGQRAGNVSGER
jgi:hypothetical protein